MSTDFDVHACRAEFPALAREVAGHPTEGGGQTAAFFDGPAGSQVPQRVIDAVAHYLAHTNANCGGAFATSRESDEVLQAAQEAMADFLGTDDPDLVVFGPNMTTITFAISRALALTWNDGDELLVTRLEHDANRTPWVLAARDARVTVRFADIRADDCTLDLRHFRSQLCGRTRLVAVSCASNAVGTLQPVREIAKLAHAAGAEVFLDAVHYAPHAPIDVDAWDCDYLVCSAYKFFGPHVGVLWGKRHLLERLPFYKVRAAPKALPGCLMTGTQNHEGIAGTRAAIDYLEELGRRANPEASGRRAALEAAFEAIGKYEHYLLKHLLDGLAKLPSVRVWGITDPARLAERVPTVSFTHEKRKPSEIAALLAERGIFVWHGNFYALPVTEALGLEPDGLVRIGLLHYNTLDEVDRLLDTLATLEPTA